MAQSVPVQPMPEFNPDAEVGASVATRWTTWLSDFEMFLLASGITDTKRQRALLLYTAGPRVREIFKQIPNNGDENNFNTAKEKLTEYFQPQTNRRYEVYRFRQTKQNQGGSLDQFHTRLRTLAQNCEFAEDNLHFEIEQQILVGDTSSRIRKRALRDPKYTLKDMLVDGRRDEISTYQSREIESTGHSDAQTHQIRPRQKQDNFNTKPCRNCGGTFPHKDFPCPAKGKECNLCKKPNHFASVCRSSVKPKQHNSISRKRRKPHIARNLALDMTAYDSYRKMRAATQKVVPTTNTFTL